MKKLSNSDKIVIGAGTGALVGGAVGYGLSKFNGWSDKKIVAYLEAKKAKDGKLNMIYQSQLDKSKNRLDHPKTVTAAHLASGAIVGAGVGALYGKRKGKQSYYSNMESDNEKFAEQFADFYSETMDIYGENLEEAYADFVEMSQDDNYFDIKGLGSKALSFNKKASTVSGGLTGAALGAGAGILAKGIHNKTKGEKFFKGTGKAALVGGTVGGVAGGALGHKVGKIGESLGNAALKEQFADFYSETVGIYGDNMEEAFNDFVEMSQDEYGILDKGKAAGKTIVAFGKGLKRASKISVGTGKLTAGYSKLAGDNKLTQLRKGISSSVGTFRSIGNGTYSDEYTDEEYGIGSTLMSGASKAASTVGSGLKKVGSVAGKTLGSTTKSMATGALVGAGVNAAKGKPILKGAVGGAVVGGAASQLYKRFSQNDNKETMNNERTYSEEEFADQFAAYYAETEDIYGDDLESAYNDFLEFSNGEAEEEMYSEEDENELADLFADFYSENVEVYGYTEEGAEEAYADFIQLVEEDEMYSEEDEEEMYSEEVNFEDFYAETYDIYGENLEEAYADFVSFTEGEEDEYEAEDEYGLKDFAKRIGTGIKNTVGEGGKLDKWIDKTGAKMKKNGLSSPYGAQKVFSAEDNADEFDTFSDGFANYYAENEDLYGDSDEGLEEAYDDFADIAAEDALEAQYSSSDSEYSILGSMKAKKDAFLKRNNTAKGKALVGGLKGAGIGAGLGLAGGLIAGSVGADAKERRALKSKAKAGTLTESEKVRYNELKANRRKKIALATGAGVVGGAAVGAGVGYAKEKSGIAKDIKNNVGSVVTSQQISKSGMSKADQQSLTDSLKKKRLDRADRNGKAGKEGDGTSYFSDKAEKEFSALDLLGTPGTKVNSFGLNKTVTKSEDKTFSDAGVEAPKSLVLGILGK